MSIWFLASIIGTSSFLVYLILNEDYPEEPTGSLTIIESLDDISDFARYLKVLSPLLLAIEIIWQSYRSRSHCFKWL